MDSGQVVRWFSSKREGIRFSYEEWLLRRLSSDELLVYRRLVEKEFQGRTLHRPVVGVLYRARRPGGEKPGLGIGDQK